VINISEFEVIVAPLAFFHPLKVYPSLFTVGKLLYLSP
jgi:hypothetical protein